MYRQIASISLIFLFLLPGLGRLWIYVEFKIHQDFIAEVLCINRDKPETMCSGTCYLNKKLKEADEKGQKQLPQVLTEKPQLTLFVPCSISYADARTAPKEEKSFNREDRNLGTDHFRRLFRPPKLG